MLQRNSIMLFVWVFWNSLLLIGTAPAAIASSIDAEHPYIQTLAKMGLDREQLPEFMILTKDFAARFQSIPNKQARQNNADLGRRIDKAYKNNDKKYRAAVAKLLNDDQLAQFPAFYAELGNMLKGRSRSIESEYERDRLQDVPTMNHH